MEKYSLLSADLVDKDMIIDFCRSTESDSSQPASVNMWHVDWQNNNFTLPYLLFKSDRFSNNNGQFNFLLHDNKIVACSGIYRSEFCYDFAVAGSRTWVNKEYRNCKISRDYLLPAERKWAIKKGFLAVGLTFNDYNKNLINLWKRSRLGGNGKKRQPTHLFYNNFNELSFPVWVQYTKQWLIYEEIGSDFEYDWREIEANAF